MTIDKATLDKLLEGVDPSNPQSMFTDAGLFGQLKKALAERMLQAELTHHLEQQRNAPEPTRNHRNGSSKKSVLAAETKLELDIPRDRDGSFEPQLVAKHQRRLPGFDDKVRVGRIIFVRLHVRLDELRRHQLHGMSHHGQLARPVMRAAARLPPDQARRQLDKVFHHLRSIQLFAQHRFALRIYAMNLVGYPPILPLRCRLKEGVHSINAIEKRTSIFSGISVADFLDSQGSLCCLNGLDG